MSLAKMLKAKDKMIPAKGFNLVGLDTYEVPGEELYLISHHATRAEAEAAEKRFAKENPGEQTFIYTSTDR